MSMPGKPTPGGTCGTLNNHHASPQSYIRQRQLKRKAYLTRLKIILMNSPSIRQSVKKLQRPRSSLIWMPRVMVSFKNLSLVLKRIPNGQCWTLITFNMPLSMAAMSGCSAFLVQDRLMHIQETKLLTTPWSNQRSLKPYRPSQVRTMIWLPQ